MAGPRVLFVKLSSLGDVVHNFPAVTDLARRHPGAHIAWAVEEAYADLVRLHPAVAEVIPVGLRRWRRHWLNPSSWSEMRAVKRHVRAQPWDYVVDTQGLLKSATVARWARGPRFGGDRASAREAIASRAYDVKLRVPRALHAVERNRLLAAQVFGYPLLPPARYGIVAPQRPLPWLPAGPYAVLVHAASHERKRWPDARWVELGERLASRGIRSVLPGGTAAERDTAARIALAIPGGVAAPALSLPEAAALLAQANAVCGVDTGLTHLAAALDVPTVGLYVATRPELTGLHAPAAKNLSGGAGGPPVDAVIEALLPDASP
ncbi:MAG TPA: lipopolysaccharide heptosyltransferase I [Usitatibacter sp.]|jgi:heptosyltransferase-1|nr:lipopolysaccharide heptosyltransferase I [Usitatibacter sp.]